MRGPKKKPSQLLTGPVNIANHDLQIGVLKDQEISVATPAEPRGEKKLFLLCKFWAVKNF